MIVLFQRQLPCGTKWEDMKVPTLGGRIPSRTPKYPLNPEELGQVLSRNAVVGLFRIVWISDEKVIKSRIEVERFDDFKFTVGPEPTE